MLASLSLRSLSVWCGVAVAGLFLGALVQPARSAVFVVPGETYYYGFNSYDPWELATRLVSPTGSPRAVGGDYTSSGGISDSVMKVMDYTSNDSEWNQQLGWHDGQSLDVVGVYQSSNDYQISPYGEFTLTEGYVVFQPPPHRSGAGFYIPLVNASTEYITHLEISYEAQNLTVANGGEYLGSDFRGFEDVAIHVFTPNHGDFGDSSPDGDNHLNASFSDSLGIRRTVTATIPIYQGTSGLIPGDAMRLYFWMDSVYNPETGQFGNAYLFDELRIRAIAAPEPGTSSMVLGILVAALTRRHRKNLL